MVKKDFYFEDLDMNTQEILIDLIVSIIENKRQMSEQEEHYEESSDICKVE